MNSFQDNDIVSRVDAPSVRCRITHVKNGGAVFEVIKKDGTRDKRWQRWSGNLDLYVIVGKKLNKGA